MHRILRSDPGRYLLSSLVAVGGLGLVNTIAANALGPAGKGNISLLLTTGALAGAVSTLGLELSMCRSRAMHANQPAPVAIAFILVSFVGLGVGFSATLAVAELTTGVPLLTAALLTGAVSISVAVTLVSTALLVADRAALAVFRSRALGTILTVIGASTLAIADVGLLSIIAAVAAGGFGTFAIQASALTRRTGCSTSWTSVGQLYPLLTAGIRAHIGTVIQSLNYRLDFFIVAALLGPAELGIYSVAVMLVQVLWFAPDALGMSLLRRIASREAADRAIADIRLAIARGTAATTLGAVALAGTAWLFLEPLFGNGFGAAYGPLLILLPGAVALSFWKLAVSYLFASGYDFSKTLGAGVAAVTSLGLDFLLIPTLGLSGAAAGATLGYTAAALVATVELYLREGISPWLLVAQRSSAV